MGTPSTARHQVGRLGAYGFARGLGGPGLLFLDGQTRASPCRSAAGRASPGDIVPAKPAAGASAPGRHFSAVERTPAAAREAPRITSALAAAQGVRDGFRAGLLVVMQTYAPRRVCNQTRNKFCVAFIEQQTSHAPPCMKREKRPNSLKVFAPSEKSTK